MVAGFLLAVTLAKAQAKRFGCEPEFVFNFTFIVFIFGIIGARIFFIVDHLGYYAQNPIEIIMLQHGGLAWFGGMFGGCVSAVVYVRRARQTSLYSMLDLLSPFVALAQAVGRIGCYLNGCCYGQPTTRPWGVHFPPDSYVSRMFGDQALHPAQLYSSATGLAIMAILLLADRKRRPEGRLFGIYLLLDSAGRFILDFYRSYEANAYIVRGLTVNQIICIGLAILGVAALLHAAKQPRTAPARDMLIGRDEATAAAPVEPQ